MPRKPGRPQRPDIKKLCDMFGVSYRSASDWIKKGCPIEPDSEIIKWVSQQRRIHPLVVETPTQSTPKIVTKIELTETPQTGFAQTLQRLEQEEARLYQEYINAKNSGNEIDTRTARKAWLEISESLRKTDIALEENRRAAGMVMPKETVIKLFKAFVYASRVALQKDKQSIVPKLAASTDVIVIDKLLDSMLKENWADSIRTLLGNDVQPWLKNEIYELIKGEINE